MFYHEICDKINKLWGTQFQMFKSIYMLRWSIQLWLFTRTFKFECTLNGSPLDTNYGTSFISMNNWQVFLSTKYYHVS